MTCATKEWIGGIEAVTRTSATAAWAESRTTVNAKANAAIRIRARAAA